MTGLDVLAKIELRILSTSAQLLAAENAVNDDPEDDVLSLRRDELQVEADDLAAAWAIVNDITIRGA